MKRRVLAIAALAALAVCVTVTLIEGRPRHHSADRRRNHDRAPRDAGKELDAA